MLEIATWWNKALVPELGRQRGRWTSAKFKASLVYKVRSRTVKDPCLKKTKTKSTTTKRCWRCEKK